MLFSVDFIWNEKYFNDDFRWKLFDAFLSIKEIAFLFFSIIRASKWQIRTKSGNQFFCQAK